MLLGRLRDGDSPLRGRQQLHPAPAQRRLLPCGHRRASVRRGWRPASGPAGDGRLPRQPVRLLHAGHRHGSGTRLWLEQPKPSDAAGPEGPARQPLPLHGLCADLAGGRNYRRLRPAGGRQAGKEPRSGRGASGGDGRRKAGSSWPTAAVILPADTDDLADALEVGTGGHRGRRRDRCGRVGQQGASGHRAGGVHRAPGRARPHYRKGRGYRRSARRYPIRMRKPH